MVLTVYEVFVLIRGSPHGYHTLIILYRFWLLNSRTISDAYSLPRVDETLEALSGSMY